MVIFTAQRFGPRVVQLRRSKCLNFEEVVGRTTSMYVCYVEIQRTGPILHQFAPGLTDTAKEVAALRRDC